MVAKLKRITDISDLPADYQNQARAQGAKGKKPSKYRNMPVVLDGIRFDSKLESRCYLWLQNRWSVGEVAWFTRQVPFRLEGGVVYRADFVVALAAGGVEVIDAKGKQTQASKNKCKQMKDRYGIEVKLWRG